MKIKDITYKSFLIFNNEEKIEYIDNVLLMVSKNYLKKENHIFENDVEEWSFIEVKELMSAISEENGLLQIIEIVSKRKEILQILDMSATKVIVSFLWLFDEIKRLIEIENQTLVAHITHETSIASQQVDFSPFGFYPQLLELAMDNILNIDKVSQLPYCDCYTYLAYKTKKQEFERLVNEAIMKKK